MSRTTSARVRSFAGSHLERVSLPMGGMGAGMICLDGNAGFSHVSLRHKPEVFHEPWIFAALCIKGKRGNTARVLEGPVPSWKIMFPWGKDFSGSGGGAGDRLWGLPRMRRASFSSRFPFGTVALSDDALPVVVTVTGWSPFIPGDSDSASLPVAGIEYTFVNSSSRTLDTVFSFHSKNFVYVNEGESGITAEAGSYVMWQTPTEEKPWLDAACAVSVDSPDAGVDTQWFRGGWFDAKTMLWKNIENGTVISRASQGDGKGAEGASMYVPLTLRPNESRTIRMRVCWYVPQSDVRAGYGKQDVVSATNLGYRPWYAARFGGITELAEYWKNQYDSLRNQTAMFTGCFYDTTLPPEVIEAVAANLTILKSPTVLRQADGRLWGWEGSCDGWGCCHGSCTHVWNYAQALPHLFPALERSLRETEFNECQDEKGHQNFRARLPIEPVDHGFHAAADGQLGGIMKVYRDWRVSGDTAWLRGLWPKVKQSLDYCIDSWDPLHKGIIEEPHHNTYDIEFWGPDGMCTSFYLGALRAATLMGQALGETVTLYGQLYADGRKYMEKTLFDGEYFFQKVQWKGLRATDPVADASRGIQQNYSPEALELLKREGPKYQYGTGCLSDGVLGEWMAQVCGVGPVVDSRKIKSHLKAVHKHNFRSDLSTHANPQRPSYALNDEAGLLLCTWPKGGALSLPFPYSNEVWTGIEYQLASHLMMLGEVERGLEIVRAVRGRYDGTVRNPFDEFECGHWYARALSSYAMLSALTGVRYDAVERTLYVGPSTKGNFRAFISTDGGYGTVVYSKGRAKVRVVSGDIPVARIVVNGKVQPEAA